LVVASIAFAIYATCLHANRSACIKWSTNEALWRHAVELDAGKHGIMNLATELMTKELQWNQTARVDEAIGLYRQLASSRPEDLTVGLGLANALVMGGNSGEALAVYEDAIKNRLEGKSSAMRHQVHANYAQVLAAVENFEEAIQSYKAAIAIKPDVANERFGLANVYRATGQDDLATAEYEYVVNEIESDHAPSWLNLGNLRKKQKGGKKEALVCFERAVAADPRNAIAYSQLGYTLQQLRRVPEATEALRTAVSIDPLHVNTWFKLAFALNKKGLTEEAIEAYHEVLALDPARGDARQNRGVLLHESGKLKEAIVEYRHVLTAAPDDGGVLLNLGLALRGLGDEDAAKEALRLAVTIQPKYSQRFQEGEV
jgi:tetratricopeptide (TPR) repeat protein